VNRVFDTLVLSLARKRCDIVAVSPDCYCGDTFGGVRLRGVTAMPLG
jgi:hypothetical protein